MNNPNDDSTPNGWLLNPASNLVLFAGNDTVILGASQRLMRSAPMLPSLLALAQPQLVKGNPDEAKAIASVIAQSSADAAFVKDEIASGFQTIFSHHVVSMWAAVESALEQALVNHIRKAPDAGQVILSVSPSLNKPKVIAAIAADAEKALQYWRSDISSQYEIHCFERDLVMLNAFSYRIALTDDQRRALVEMSEVRNLFLHRSGFIDARFLGKTRLAGVVVGERLTISDKTMIAYGDAVRAIALAMINASVDSPYIYRAPLTENVALPQ